MNTIIFKIKGMHCDSCKALIEDVASEVAGVAQAVVNKDAHVLTIDHDEKFSERMLLNHVNELGAGYELLRL